MNYTNNSKVRQCVEELASLLTDGNVDARIVEKSVRMLRPNKGAGVEHTAAIRARIRQSILNNSNSSDAQLELNKFEKQCDAVQRLNPKHLNPFLQFFQPLSFPPERSVARTRVSAPTAKKETERAFTGGEAADRATGDSAALASGSIAPSVAAEENRNEVEATAAIWVTKEIEHLLLVDIIYILQGISGKHIKFDTKTENYVLDPSLRLNSTVRDTVLCICELGWLYGRVAQYLKTTLTVATETKGMVVQAFGFALQEELNDYYRLLAVLEQELKGTPKPIPGAVVVRPADLTRTAGAGRRGGGDSGAEVEEVEGADGGTSGLTLLRLKAWLHEPIERMCQLARMVDGAIPLRGGALISRLYGHAQHGDPATRGLVRRVLDSVCAPLYTVLSRWVLYGELQDPHKEFFVALNATASIRNIWRDTYALHHAMIPAYFSHTMAQKILLIGKSINFIRLCLQKLPRITARDAERDASKSNTTAGGVRKSFRAVNKGKVLGLYGQVHTVGEEMVVVRDEEEGEAVVDDSLALLGRAEATDAKNSTGKTAANAAHRALTMADVLGTIVTPTVQHTLQNLRYGGEAQLQDIVYQLSAGIDAKLLNLVMSRFYVQTHLLALKKFMLLGQGDFVTCLMDGVGPELKRRANQLFRHNLTGILEGALRASNAQFEPSYVLDRIGIRLLEASAGDSGWEIFSLDYAIDAPLNAVVHMDCVSKYRIAFHMLWRLKRVEWSLTTTWKQHTMFNHSNRAHIPPALRAVFHRCYLNRATMMHVVNNLCAFLMFEVLETSWLNLQETIGRARCLDDVITAHDAYLSEVLDRALLAPHHEGLNMQVQQVLHIVLRFCSLEETLISDAMASIARRKVAASAADQRSQAAGKGKKEAKVSDSPMSSAAPSASSTPIAGVGLDGVPEAVVARIDETVKEYSRQFDTLMTMLKEQGEKAGDILRFLTFRLDFNDFHLQQRAHGGGVGLTSTPPAHLKSARGAFFPEGGAAGAGAGGGGRGAAQDGADRLSFQSDNVSSPQRSDSPTFGFSGPEAWSVPPGVGAGAAAAAGGARPAPAAAGAKAKLSSTAGGKYLR